jgi:hypothetical protein
MTYGNDAYRSLVMNDIRVNAAELRQALAKDIDDLLDEVVAAMNAAEGGRIIADSEEPVRNASAAFRQRLYEKALSLLQAKQEAFSPSAWRTEEQGKAGHDAPDDQRTGPGV